MRARRSTRSRSGSTASARSGRRRRRRARGRATTPARRETSSMKRTMLIVGLLASLGAVGRAQEEDKRKGGGRVIKLEATVVEGHVHKPQAFYLLQRSNLDYDWESL